ncbi:ABC transporter ATP-binding protein [Clostridium sp. Marseille-P299]|uniref:ABC transporter ATP-binding protein n=1 Tax=Clostridium sp. Marseille-P299 TaxID=1805477 RepID=UPI000A7E3CB8
MKNEVKPIIEVRHVKKIYRMGSERISAVDDVSFEINKGEFCCLLGTSGSGKSTLLNLMAGIEKASAGEIIIKGRNIHKMNENKLAKFRQKYLGFVFQSYNLINSMTALENVEFPLVFKRVPLKRRKKMAKDMLVKVGLGTRLKHKPKEMSGGQQQRVGIARAFVSKPEIVFADEPTGNLDTKTTMEVMELIKDMARDNHQTIVMVTHDKRLAEFADKIIHILDGKIQSIEIVHEVSMEDIDNSDVDSDINIDANGDTSTISIDNSITVDTDDNSTNGIANSIANSNAMDEKADIAVTDEESIITAANTNESKNKEELPQSPEENV